MKPDKEKTRNAQLYLVKLEAGIKGLIVCGSGV